MRICAPFAGIVHYHQPAGARVDTGALIAVVESVKLEAPLHAPGPGIVGEHHFDDYADVEGGDELLTLAEDPAH